MGFHDGHRERRKDQFRRYGLDGFADHEVLELLLFYAIPRRDTNELAHRLLERFGSLQGVLATSREELESVEGMGESTALFLTLIPALGHRLYRGTVEERIINTVEEAGDFFLHLLSQERRESLYQVCLDGKGKMLACCRLSTGTAAMTQIGLREVVETALRCSASRVLLGHNHPSGVALPSQEDRQATEQIAQALRVMDIALMDHIVVADGDFVSMAASGMLM